MNVFDFYYLGARDYVNGLTLFEHMLRGFQASPEARDAGSIEVDLFKVSQFVRHDCRMEMHRPDRDQPGARVREAAARMDLLTTAGRFLLLLFPLAQRPVRTRCEDYDRSVYIADTAELPDGSVLARFANVGDACDLLRGIIEVNHRLVKRESVPLGIDESPSWAYMTHYRIAEPGELKREPPHARFSLKGVTTSRARRYIVRSVKVGHAPADLELCFFTRGAS